MAFDSSLNRLAGFIKGATHLKELVSLFVVEFGQETVVSESHGRERLVDVRHPVVGSSHCGFSEFGEAASCVHDVPLISPLIREAFPIGGQVTAAARLLSIVRGLTSHGLVEKRISFGAQVG
tara:strand:- start:15690 stop:16055 length:366 start_codon:yes stop_codon:yes gene_type:complete